MEIPIRIEELYRKLAERLKKGDMVIVDYGYTFAEWYRPNLKNGSLRGYKNHRRVEVASEWKENNDMTTHIHFDALLEWEKEYGLKTVVSHQGRNITRLR
ncbi:SAM-dependent methyltransferase [Fervidibacillus albus]|uniref:SAM-dependent methyltransferase n=1 Tax=Fervidibacillus albus TaxID=2980026 RepID=A0A9E8RYA5_9BACI|nr:SAM-dependent methyltransferase [Fervidibacillus albus]WAA10427.1 SAM-dependent methyltransferase [Fervidibacillus albus]